MSKRKFAPKTTQFKAGDKFFWFNEDNQRMEETVKKVVFHGHPGDNEVWVEDGMGWLPEHLCFKMKEENID